MIIIITSDLRLLHHLLFSLHHHFHHLSIFPSHHHHHHNCIVFLLLPTHYYCFSADRQKPGFKKMPKSGQKWSKEKDSRPSKWMNGVHRRNIGSNDNKSYVVFPQLINMHVLWAKSQWTAPRITCCLHCKMKAVVNRTCLIMLVGRWFVENHFTMQSAVESSNLLQLNAITIIIYNLQIIYMICVKKSKYLAVVRGNVTWRMWMWMWKTRHVYSLIMCMQLQKN